MLEPLYKNEPVNESEKKLSSLLNQNFFNLWSHIGIWRKEGIKNGKGQGTEVCDGVVVFGNKVLIFSDKNISFNYEKPLDTAWSRWFKKSITESIKQLRGAEKRFREQKHRIFLDNLCQIPFPIELSENLEIHLIAVVSNIRKPAQTYFDSIKKGSSGSLMYFNKKEISQDKFIIYDFDPSDTFVHVLDDQTLNLLIHELPTIKDFIDYIEVKEKLLRQYNLISYCDEADLLGYYLDKRFLDNKQQVRFSYPSLNNIIVLEENYWNEITHNIVYKKHQDIKDKAKPYNKLLGYISECIVSADLSSGMNLPIMSHEYVLRSFAEESMFDRAKLSEKIIETITIAPNKTVLRIIKKDRDNPKYFMILALPFKKGETESEYSERRYFEAEIYSIALKGKFNEIKELSIITMPPNNSKLNSYLTLVIDYKEDLDISEKNIFSRIMIDKGFKALSSIEMDIY